MCKLCDIRKEIDKIGERLNWRIMHYQQALRHGETAEAQVAKQDAKVQLEKLFEQFDLFQSELVRGKDMSDVSELLQKKLFGDGGSFH